MIEPGEGLRRLWLVIKGQKRLTPRQAIGVAIAMCLALLALEYVVAPFIGFVPR